MTGTHPADALIQKYLDGIASAPEAVELDRALAADPDAADAFARATRLDAALGECFADRRHARRAEAVVAAVMPEPAGHAAPASVRLPVRWLAAAVLLLAAGAGWLLLSGIGGEAPAAVVAGRVLVDGVEGRPIRDGASVEVLGDEAAVLRLSDGSLAELAPASRAIIHGRTQRGRPGVELTQGSGEFQVQEGARHFRVDTPVGKVSASGTEFAVALRPAEADVESAVRRNVAAALIVAVMAGSVQVRYRNADYALGIGDNRVYAGGKVTPGQKPDLAGKVVEVAADGRAITLEAGTLRRAVQLTEQTRLSYVNVPVGGERPAPGYQAQVWLAGGAPDSAAAVAFAGKKIAPPKPDLAGRVTAVSPDGRAVTLQLPPPKKGQPARTARFQIGDHTRESFALVPFDGERPTVGYHASVWLAAGSRDEAARVAFSGKKANAPDPNLAGRVTAVSADGKDLTLQVPPRTKGEAASARAVKIRERTKLVYKGLDKDRQKPAVGLVAAVWLEKGSPDIAAGIRFIPGPQPKPATAGKPAAPRPPADGAAVGFFALPRGIELTAGQRPEVAALIRELTPEYKTLERQRDAVLTAGQKAALAVTRQAVKESGLTEPRLVQEALDAAAEITPAQKERTRELARQEQELHRRYLDRLGPLLTEQQRARLPGAAKDAGARGKPNK
jgi:hypothetical protein